MPAASRSLAARTSASLRSSVTPPPAWLMSSRAASSVTCRSRSASRCAFSMATAAWSARTPRSRSSSSENRSSPSRERTTTPMTRPSERSGARMHRLLVEVHRARDVDGAWVGGRIRDVEGLSGGGHPAGDALPDGDPQARHGLAQVLASVGPEGDRVEGAAVLVEHVDPGIVEGHDALGVGAQRSAHVLDARQARELRRHALDRFELRRPGDGARAETRHHGPHEATGLHPGEREVVLAERLGAPAFEDEEAPVLIGQDQVRGPCPGGSRRLPQPARHPAARGVPGWAAGERGPRGAGDVIGHGGHELEHAITAVEVQLGRTVGVDRGGESRERHGRLGRRPDHRSWDRLGGRPGRAVEGRGPAHGSDEEDDRTGGDDGVSDGEDIGERQRSRPHEDVAQEREERVWPDEDRVREVADRAARPRRSAPARPPERRAWRRRWRGRG